MKVVDLFKVYCTVQHEMIGFKIRKLKDIISRILYVVCYRVVSQ